MNSCILCGKEAFSDQDNVCKGCIDDLIAIDAIKLPDWLFFLNMYQSLDIVMKVRKYEKD